MVDILIKILLLWYILIFVSTEFLSLFHILNRANISILNLPFIFILIRFTGNKIKSSIKRINLKSKTSRVILLILLLTFIQGLISAPSTTDSMVYHIPRIMYWMQEQTIEQNVIRNPHDFMPPFAEFISLHLYQIFGNDRFLFFSQWLAFAASIYLSGLISIKLGMSEKMAGYTQLIIATLPIAVLQASSTQTDMVTTVFVMLSLYISLCLLENFSFENLFLLGAALGLGSLVKSSFYIFSIIPLGLLTIELLKKRSLIKLFLISISLSIALIIQIPFFFQNVRLYGSIFGTNLINQDSVYSNDEIGLNITVSNLIRNIFIQLPFPLISNFIEKEIVKIHEILDLPINDSRTTFENSAFHIQQIIFPQEDIAGNPLHLFLIAFAGVYLIFNFKEKNTKSSTIFLLSILSFIIFSTLLKWQQQHPRLEIPFFMIGSIVSIKILDFKLINKKVFKFFLSLSVILAFISILFNTSHPFFSYSPIYKYVQKFATPLSSIPEAFYIEPRIMQYFNSRYYWFDPYNKVVDEISSEKVELNFNLKDGFEYPFWILLNNKQKKFYLVSQKDINETTILITTTEDPFYMEGYRSICFETPIKYGFACISRRSYIK